MDEIGLIESHGANNLVVGKIGIRTLLKKTPGFKAWISFIEYISASDVAIAHLIIFKEKTVQTQWFLKDLKPFKDWHFTSISNVWTFDITTVE